LWDVYNENGGSAIVVGVPPSYPPRRLMGANVGCFLTPDTTRSDYTWPSALRHEIDLLVGEYPVDVKGFRTNNKAWLLGEIYEMTRRHFDVVRHLMTTRDWDLFQFVEIGLDRIHHGFWKHHDPLHRQHEPGSPFELAIRKYYQYLDKEIGTILELLDEDTTVLVVSDHGAQRLDGGFCVNEWLRREGLLFLNEEPSGVTPFSPGLVDWSRTRVWSEGGYYARVFFNLEGREPNGVLSQREYEAFRAEMIQRLEALPDDTGKPMGTRVFRPDTLYRNTGNIPPDLIVHFGDLFWRSIGSVGHRQLHVQENDTGPDDCNHAQFGTFILNGAGVPAAGELQGSHLLDIAPTLLELAGLPVPGSMQGRDLLQDVPALASSQAAGQ
jgi:predicted AlkP superfamily phosphohydrolase/phosphomutase